MTMDLLSGELERFTPAIDDDFGLANLFSSNPDYDEASGPERDDRYYLVDEFSDGEWTEEDEEDYWDRLMFQDPDEPFGPGETAASVRASMMDTRPLITVDLDFMPICGPAPMAAHYFDEKELQPAKPGTVSIGIKKFDRQAKRMVRAQTSVAVTVRRLKPMEPH